MQLLWAPSTCRQLPACLPPLCAHPAPFSPPVLPPPQAIAAWRDNSDWGRCQLVKSYFAAATGAFGEPEVVKGVEVPAGGAVQRLQAWAGGLLGGGGVGDPFFAVVAYRQ